MGKQLQQQGVLLADHKLDEKSVVVIGDVHGCADALREILAQVYGTKCTLVFTGDLIDRGDDSDVVLRTVRSLHEKPRSFGLKAVHVVRGNHEQMALDAHVELQDDHVTGNPLRMAKGDYALWLQNGGTKDDFDFMTATDMWSWLETLPLYYEHPAEIEWEGDEAKKLLVSHASVESGIPLDEQERDILIWDRHVEGYSKDHLTVHGHTICRNGEPAVYETKTGDVLRIDTGSFVTGIVTGIALREVGAS